MFTCSADTLHCTYMHVRICIHTFTDKSPLIHTHRMGRLPSTLQQPMDMRMLFNYCLKQTWIQI